MRPRTVIASSVALVAFFAAASAFGGQASCEDLNDLALPDVRITEAAPAGSGGTDAPHCKVTGVIGKEINFVLLLPDGWNGRFFMGGGGGYVGSVQNSAQPTVNRGYATVGTDTGHQDGGISAEWALHNAERQVNFGHLAIHRTAEVAKAIIRSFYGKQPEYSYFLGCSRGGGQALMEAQRYPEDFDGIVAGAPAFDWTTFMGSMIQNVQLNYPDPGNLTEAVISNDNLDLLETRILQACDDLDSVVDGVMEDPRRCTFELDSIPGCSDEAASDCLTQAQRAAIERIYAPATDPQGQFHPGWAFGGESEGAGWKSWIVGPGAVGMPNLHYGFATQFFKYFVYGDPDWDYSQYDFSTWRSDTRFAASFLDATDTELRAFKERNGKLILWHGWSDPALSALRTIDYFEEAESKDPSIRDHLRLFLMPGMLHCGGGPGPDQVDWFDVIADWVERDEAPDRLIATKSSGGELVRSRPLCPYPQIAVYQGSGSTDKAQSFTCQAP